MALEHHRHIGIALQPCRLAPKDLLAFRRDVGAIVVEEHAVPRGLRQILLRARSDTRRVYAAWSAGADASRPALRRRIAAAGGQHEERAGDGEETYKHDELPF